MIHHVWRLSDGGSDNLGLACTEDGLVLGRTLRCPGGSLAQSLPALGDASTRHGNNQNRFLRIETA
jgi:hypothetical protein